MEAKHCEYCGKKLSSRRRSDARYCPTSRCRVGGYRRRAAQNGTDTYAPYNRRRPSRGTQVISRWQQAGMTLVPDPWCQAQAEKLAYELIERRCAERRREAADRLWKEHSPVGRKETIIGPGEPIVLPNKVRCVGLVLLPTECGGGAVLVTGTEQDSRYLRR